MSVNLKENGATISFHSIDYRVNVSQGWFKKPKPFQILHDVNGLMKPGLNAIMGPSGGGKTTLLNLLAGRVDLSDMGGKILVDSMQQPENFRCLSGFVSQDDVVMGTLTVRENIMFSANVRLPKCISKEEKKRRVEEIIYELGLQSCADTIVGMELTRGVSGGERKRTNIGMELIISPKVLFLDEPTTGLDSSTAYAVMKLLKTISETGRTIIFSIHQPCYNIFKLFDSMLLLSSGRVIYHGLSSQTLAYFSNIGYECEEHNNPSDFFLDVANGDNSAIMALKGLQAGAAKPDKALCETLHDEFSQSRQFDSLKKELDSIYESYRIEGSDKKSAPVTFATGFISQFYHLSKRTITNIARNPSALLLQNIIMVFFSLFVGVIYFQLGNDIDGAIQNRVGAFYFMLMNQIFGNLSSIELFLREQVIFIHESTSGFYRVSAYFFTKFFFDLLPMRFIPATLLSVVSYFMIGLQLDATKFFIFYLTLLLTSFSSSAIGFAVSARVKIYSVANLIVTFIFVYMQVFGGFLVNLTTMVKWLSWMQYMSIVRFALNALSITELKDIKLYNNSVEIPNVGSDYLTAQGIRHETAWDLWQNNLALLIMIVVFLVVAYWNLLMKSRSFG